MPSHSSGSGGGSAGAEAAFSGLVTSVVAIVLVVVVLLIIWGVNLVLRAFKQHPKEPALWAGLMVFGGSWGLVGLTTTASGPTADGVFVAVAFVATAVLLIVARVVLLHKDDLLQVPPERLVTKVFARPWWTPLDAQ